MIQIKILLSASSVVHVVRWFPVLSLQKLSFVWVWHNNVHDCTSRIMYRVDFIVLWNRRNVELEIKCTCNSTLGTHVCRFILQKLIYVSSPNTALVCVEPYAFVMLTYNNFMKYNFWETSFCIHLLFHIQKMKYMYNVTLPHIKTTWLYKICRMLRGYALTCNVHLYII